METVLSLNENSQENSSSQEKKVTKQETSAEELIGRIAHSSEICFLRTRKGESSYHIN